ncbi:MAG: NAD(P)-binding domain-containing protein [Verrucomicrobiota bacterium]
MLGLIKSYAHWLHTQWPAGTVEKLPAVNDNGTTNVPGVYVVGDLTGIPLLKFAADTGAKAVHRILAEPDFAGSRHRDGDVLDLVIIGASVSGVAAAIEAQKAQLNFKLFEASRTFSTIANFPKGKPIFTYPTDFTPEGDFQVSAPVKEELMEEMEAQRIEHGIEPIYSRINGIERKKGLLVLTDADGNTHTARRVIIGIGRSGNFRKLGVPGEELDKVSNRLHDPKDFGGKRVLVVGGGDSAMEAAIALACCGAHVTLSYRKPEFSRPKPENLEMLHRLAENPASSACIEKPSSERVTTAASSDMRETPEPGSLSLKLATNVKEITDDEVTIAQQDGQTETLANDAVFAMIGREPPLDFFRRSGVNVRGDTGPFFWAGMLAFVLFCWWLYHWKGHKPMFGVKGDLFGIENWYLPSWLDPNPALLIEWFRDLGGWLGTAFNDPTTLLGTIANSALQQSFYYTLAYSLVVVIFGIRRMRRRRTPYIYVQTSTLMSIQVIPLFVLPEIILPWLGNNGWFMNGTTGGWWADHFFEAYDDEGIARAYWRAYGFILAFPLFVYNWFTAEPMWGWIVVGALQTFVLIPGLIYFFGKGSYCGWICSCGALAETLGDQHRHKMPHGPFWNRLNMLGQGVLAFAFILLFLRILGWIGVPGAAWIFDEGFAQVPLLNYQWLVDLLLAGVLGYGVYFWYSGRAWCRFACPLAALMHIYARFSRFRIFADKKKCISCNVCTSVCHQGIDIMNFANKGRPMEDPECVRCSACVQSCPTGVLTFGRQDGQGGMIADTLTASPVHMKERQTAAKTAAEKQPA